MILGVGIDLAEVGRLREDVRERGDGILGHFLTPAEIAYCRTKQDPFPHYSARFAAKEAFVKALGTGFAEGLTAIQVEIVMDAGGRPTVLLAGRAAEAARERGVRATFVSLSHERGHAVALVVLEG